MSTTIRITDEAHGLVKALAKQSGRSLQTTLEEAIEELRRKRFFEAANAAFAALRSESGAWEEETAERRLWEATLADGEE